MCGICGFVGFRDDELLKRMMDSLVHRGPDGEGCYVTDKVSLGVRRLAVIDLETGDQPIYNEDRSIVIVFDGRIYNFKELRQKLEFRGHRFYTKTDTEVIIHLYEEYSEECLEYLCGMFAFAIWDSKREKLFLARDRLGIKPLFYAQINGNLIFASEIKSILQCNEVSRNINLLALDRYFTFFYIPQPETIFKNIYHLPPASWLLHENRKIRIKKYWDLKFQCENRLEEYYLNEFEEVFKKVIVEHLISDVPIGILLSGGRDSSIIALYASKIMPQINTFTIGYHSEKDADYNELDKARIVAKCLNVPYAEFVVSPDLADLIVKVVMGEDQPFADSSSIPMYLVSKLARGNCAVALTGIGGDELFCGYPRYQGMKISMVLPQISLPHILIELLRESYAAGNPLGRFKRFLYSLRFGEIERYISMVSYLRSEYKNMLYTELFKNVLSVNSYPPHKHFFELVPKENILNKMMYVDVNTYLCDDLLCMADRMCMLNSLEIRVPFCDHRVVEFAANIPPNLRMKGLTLKYLLRRLMSRYFPRVIVEQKKAGFMIPLARWLKDEFNKQVYEFIRKQEFGDYLRYSFINWMWENHINKRRNFSDQLWSLLVFSVWKDVYKIDLPNLKVYYRPKKLPKFKKILLINIAGIGDFIQSIDAIRCLKGKHPKTEISLLVSKKVYNYAKTCPYVDKVYFLPTKRGRVFHIEYIYPILLIAIKLRKEKFDVVANMYQVDSFLGGLGMGCFIKVIGGKINIGRDTNKMGFLLDKKIKDNIELKKTHFEYYADVIKAIDEEIEVKRSYSLWSSAEEKENADKILSEFGISENDFLVGIFPGSERLTRRWDAKKFACVADHFINRYSAKVLIFGGKEDEALQNEISNNMKFHCFGLCGKTTIGELIEIVRRCTLIISTFSSVLQIAGAYDIAAVCIGGCGLPYRDRPFSEKIQILWKDVGCNPCYYYKCPNKKTYMQCMEVITPEEVIKAAEKLLQST